MNNLPQVLEAILFVSGDGIGKEDILDKLKILEEDLDEALSKLQEKYNSVSGVHIITYRNKIQMCSNSDYAEEVASVLNPIRERKLSKAMLEAMSIIAYKQPITRLEVENIRGVNSDYAIQNLLKHNLVEVIGRKDTLGKPMLFGTTEEFLKRFEIESLNQLPDYEELIESISLINAEDKTLYNEFDVDEENEKESEANNEENEEDNTEKENEEQEKQNNDELEKAGEQFDKFMQEQRRLNKEKKDKEKQKQQA